MEGLRKRRGFRVSVCGQEELEQISRDGSQYSLTTGILPSLGARSNRRVKLRPFVISPYDRRYRGDDLLLHHLLKRGLDPNESDNRGRTSLHIAASKGNENCVLLLLDYGADPNCRDCDGSVPLWEAILGGHEPVVQLLKDNGANLPLGDIGDFACTAAEQNNLLLLKEIVRYGGDVTSFKSNGTTALHVAVCEENIEIVKFLLKQGADIDKPDVDGWTPRDLADQLRHEEIKNFFRTTKVAKTQSVIAIPEKQTGVCFLGRLTSEPMIHPLSQEGNDGSRHVQSRPQRRTYNFNNSLFGIMSAIHSREKDTLFHYSQSRRKKSQTNPARVIISCSEIGKGSGKLVFLPGSFNELLEIGAKKFGIIASKVLNEDGAAIEDIEVIRDGDRLIFESVKPETLLDR